MLTQQLLNTFSPRRVPHVLAVLATWLAGLRAEEGQGMVEYGLIIALIAVVVIATVTALGTQIKTEFCSIITGLGGTCP